MSALQRGPERSGRANRHKNDNVRWYYANLIDVKTSTTKSYRLKMGSIGELDC